MSTKAGELQKRKAWHVVAAGFAIAGCDAEKDVAVSGPLVGTASVASGIGVIAGDDGIDRGVFYYPGWSWSVLNNVPPNNGPYDGNDVSGPYQSPWEMVTPWAASRHPDLGFVENELPAVTNEHILGMSDAGFDYVIYDWYWCPWNAAKGEVGDPGAADSLVFDGAISNHVTSPYKDRLDFAIAWWDHHDEPTGDDMYFWQATMTDLGWTPTRYEANIRSIALTWLNRYIIKDGYLNPNYKVVDGNRPLIFVHGAGTRATPYNFLGDYSAGPDRVVRALRAVFGAYGLNPYLVATGTTASANIIGGGASLLQGTGLERP